MAVWAWAGRRVLSAACQRAPSEPEAFPMPAAWGYIPLVRRVILVVDFCRRGSWASSNDYAAIHAFCSSPTRSPPGRRPRGHLGPRGHALRNACRAALPSLAAKNRRQSPASSRRVNPAWAKCITARGSSVIVRNEDHLRRILKAYFHYYHHWRTHLSLDRNSPIPGRPRDNPPRPRTSFTGGRGAAATISGEFFRPQSRLISCNHKL